MIVPAYWAEARLQHRASGKQITIRRYGWSDLTQAAAQDMADARAEEGLRRVLAGEKLVRRERKVAYNGALGLPIREEVIARHGADVITRNGYGAHCLNSPNTLFADIDFESQNSIKNLVVVFVSLAVLGAAYGMFIGSLRWILVLLFAAIVLTAPVTSLLRGMGLAIRGGPEKIARLRVAKWLTLHPTWNIRVYRTPAGLRLLATHAQFSPQDTLVQEFFRAMRTDSLYVRMCHNQACFRARLTAKPWRIGITGHMRPRPGVWPIRPENMAVRTAWVQHYESTAQAYAACRFMEAMGSGTVDIALQHVIHVHDMESRALLNGMTLA